MAELLRLARSVRHTHARQLAARAWLIGKRRVLEGVVAIGGEHAPALDAYAPPLRAELPRPIFAPRRALLRGSPGQRRLAFLGLDVPLGAPIDWQPRAWQRGTRLELLNLHYMEWAEALEDREFEACALDWIAHNPRGGRDSWRGSWNCYALSIRALVWLQQLALRRARLSAACLERMRASLSAQLEHLARNLELDIGGNHLIKNLKALLWAASAFEGPRARAWGALGERLLARELELQILPDGMHYERSPAYHAQVLADLLECHAVLGAGALRDELERVLARMAQVCADTTHPDGLPSLFNDGGLHMAYAPGELLARCERALGLRVAARASFALEHAGSFGLRSADELLLFDAGPIGPDELPAHGHGDLLSFEWSVAGRRVVVDPGVFEYHAGEKRAWSRSTRAHATVELDGRDQCEFYQSFRVGARARPRVLACEWRTGWLDVEAEHDGYARLRGAPVHRRRLRARAGAFEIEDRILGGAGQPALARLPLHPEVHALLEGARAQLCLADGSVIALECSAALAVEPARYCPDFGIEQWGTALRWPVGRAGARLFAERVA